MRWLLLIGLLLLANRASLQDFEWWRDNVQWDGTTHWREYIITAPRFMGPNALPVPPMTRPLTDSLSSLTIGSLYHTTPGDQTMNPEITFRYLPIPKRMAIQFRWIPLEYFRTDHATQTLRKVFYWEYDSQIAAGDVYMETFLHLFRQNKLGVDVVNRIAFRFPTGNKLGAARFMDSPAYYFDLALARKVGNWRFLLMGGFLVWQTNQDEYLQNDAILYGLGLEKSWGPLTLAIESNGYIGYLNNGDRPLQVQSALRYRTGDWQFALLARKGFIDNLYQTLGFSAQRFFRLPPLRP